MQESVKQDRDKYIGGSDISTIMGINPFKKRFTLLREKCGLQTDDFNGNIYTEFGQAIEPKIREWINITGGHNFVEGKHFHPLYFNGKECEDISCRIHTDGEEDDTILEIKSTSHIYETVDEYKAYLVQLLYYMAKEHKRYGLLGVYERPETFDLNNVVFDADRLTLFPISIENYGTLISEIESAVEKFLEDREKMLENPFITEEELMPKDIAYFAQNMLYLEEKLKEYESIKKEYEAQKQSLYDAMNKQGIPSWRTEHGILLTVVAPIVATTETKTVFDADKFSEEHPRLYKKYSSEETVTKSGRKGYIKITYPKGE